MTDQGDPIKFPADFPPKSGWNQFFLGVRWLGPDISFFRTAQDNQSRRTEKSMEAWDDPELRELALQFGRPLQRHLRWKSCYFLPKDDLQAVLHGPKFESVDGDLDAKNAIEEFHERIGVSLPISFWETRLSSTLLVVLKDIKNYRLQT